MKKFLLVFLLGLLSQASIAHDMNPHPPHHNLPPPNPVMPQAGNNYISGHDVKTRSRPTSDMDTVRTRTTGSEIDAHPRSNPIPLERAPLDLIP